MQKKVAQILWYVIKINPEPVGTNLNCLKSNLRSKLDIY